MSKAHGGGVRPGAPNGERAGIGPHWVIPEYLQEIVDEDPSEAREMLRLYVEDTEEQLRNLTDSFERDDRKALASISHTLKGSAYQVGAHHMGDTAAAIENSLAEGSPIKAHHLLPALLKDWEPVRLALNATLAIIEADTKRNVTP